jgi:hypothetical protein
MGNANEVEREEVRGMVAVVEWDPEPCGVESPRDCDGNLGTFYFAHGRYTYGDPGVTVPDTYESEPEADGCTEDIPCESWADVLRAIVQRDAGGADVVAVAVGMIDHSGISFYAGGGPAIGDASGWDSGTVGWMVALPATLEECGMDATRDRDGIVRCLRGEVEALDAWARGEVYGWRVETATGETVAGCGGYIGGPVADILAEAVDDAGWWADAVDYHAATLAAVVVGPDLAAAMRALDALDALDAARGLVEVGS